MVVTAATRKSFGTLLLLCWITIIGSTDPRIIKCPKGTNVKDGYIREGTVATCQCVGYNQGHMSPYWDADGDVVVETKGPGYSTLNVTMQDRNKKFTCMMDGVKGSELRGGTFVPKFAYGPSEVHTEVSTKRTCFRDNQREPVNITCNIPRDTVNPYPNVTILTSPFTSGVTSQMILSEVYRFVYTFYTDSHHNLYNFTCTVRNGIFSDLVLRESGEIVVGMSTPTIRVNDGPKLTSGMTAVVAENETVTLHCQVENVGPTGVAFHLTCQQQQQHRYQQNAANNARSDSLIRIFTRAQSNLTCTCIVHSICEAKETTITIIVQVAGSSDDAVSSSALETGAVVGIVLAAIFVVTVIIVTAVCWVRRKRAKYRMKEREHYDTLDVQESDAHPYRDLQHSAETRLQAPPPPPHKPLAKVRPQQPQTTRADGNQAVRALEPHNPTPFTSSKHPVRDAANGQEKFDTSATDSDISAHYEEYIEPVDSPLHYNGTQTMGSSNYSKPVHTQSHYTEPQISPSSNFTECGNTLSHYSEPEIMPSHDYRKLHIEQFSDYIEPADPPSEYLEPSFPQYESLQGQTYSSSPHYSQLSGQTDPPYFYSGLTVTDQAKEYTELTDEQTSGYIIPEDPPSHYT